MNTVRDQLVAKLAYEEIDAEIYDLHYLMSDHDIELLGFHTNELAKIFKKYGLDNNNEIAEHLSMFMSSLSSSAVATSKLRESMDW